MLLGFLVFRFFGRDDLFLVDIPFAFLTRVCVLREPLYWYPREHEYEIGSLGNNLTGRGGGEEINWRFHRFTLEYFFDLICLYHFLFVVVLPTPSLPTSPFNAHLLFDYYTRGYDLDFLGDKREIDNFFERKKVSIPFGSRPFVLHTHTSKPLVISMYPTDN